MRIVGLFALTVSVSGASSPGGDSFKANCSVVPVAPPPRQPIKPPRASAKRIRWFVGNDANWGCLLSKANFSNITDGVIQCCSGVGFGPDGQWLGGVLNEEFFGPFLMAGKERYATVMMYAGNSTYPGGDLCTGMLANKEAIAQQMLQSALASNLTGYNLDVELGYNNSVKCFVELWSFVGDALRKHGVQLGTDIDQSCLRLPAKSPGACSPTAWSYEWDFEPMEVAFDYFTEMATYPSNHDRPANANLSPSPCAANASRNCGIKGYITDLLDHGVPAEKISAGLSIAGLPGQIGCGEPRDGCGTVGGCNASFDPHGSTSGSGWTKDSLRQFLDELDKRGVTSIDLWTGDAFELPQSVAICSWIIDELRRWRHANH